MGHEIRNPLPKRGDEALQKILNCAEKAAPKGEDTRSPSEQQGVQIILIEDIVPNRFQPRISFDEKKLMDLSLSLKDHGLLQPILLRMINRSPVRYEIIAGERRVRAAKSAGLAEVPAIVREVDDKDMKILTLTENLQRQDLTVVEKTLAIGSFQEEVGDIGTTALNLRLSRRTVERYVTIYKVVNSSATLRSLFLKNAEVIDFKTAEALANVARDLRAGEMNDFVSLANSDGIDKAMKKFRRPLSAVLSSKREGQSVVCVTKETERHVVFLARCEKEEEMTAESRDRLRRTFQVFLDRLCDSGLDNRDRNIST